jgi:hypothetical protein
MWRNKARSPLHGCFILRYGLVAPPIKENIIQGARDCEIYILHSYFHREDPHLKIIYVIKGSVPSLTIIMHLY